MSPSLTTKIAEVFDEPGCEINQTKSAKDRKKGCTKQPTPGAAAGGCAFDGAKIALQPIVDVAHLVHGPIACEGNSRDNRHSASSGPQTYRTGFTTDIHELDVIHGAETRLFKAIREVIERQDPAAVFVYQTCVTGMIGDDIEAVCQRAAEKFGKPVIPVNSPGFAGPKKRLAGKKVLLITGGVKSWSVAAALQEAGLEVVGTSVKKSTNEDKEKIEEIMGDDAHMIDDLSPREMYAMLKDAKADIMLRDGRSQFVALKARMPWMDINQERHHAFAGYECMVTMVEEIDKALFNPVWQQVRTPAPCDTQDAPLAA